ncbi:hypothetical protein BUE76_21990 [Cnuella takakiae]|nr:hypothetical protein BUE76_21990 [Cnuella takakiae]
MNLHLQKSKLLLCFEGSSSRNYWRSSWEIGCKKNSGQKARDDVIEYSRMINFRMRAAYFAKQKAPAGKQGQIPLLVT